MDLFLWEEERLVDKSGCIHLGGNAYPVAEHLVGRQVTVRFDPFDLSRLRLYENGHFSYVLEPQTLVSRTYRKALPKEKKGQAPLDSSAAYRDQLSRSFRDRADRTQQHARGQGSCLSQPEFLRLLQEALNGGQFSAAEGKWVVDFFARNAPLGARLVQAALQQAVEAKGTSLHIRYYLGSIETEMGDVLTPLASTRATMNRRLYACSGTTSLGRRVKLVWHPGQHFRKIRAGPGPPSRSSCRK